MEMAVYYYSSDYDYSEPCTATYSGNNLYTVVRQNGVTDRGVHRLSFMDAAEYERYQSDTISLGDSVYLNPSKYPNEAFLRLCVLEIQQVCVYYIAHISPIHVHR